MKSSYDNLTVGMVEQVPLDQAALMSTGDRLAWDKVNDGWGQCPDGGLPDGVCLAGNRVGNTSVLVMRFVLIEHLTEALLMQVLNRMFATVEKED